MGRLVLVLLFGLLAACESPVAVSGAQPWTPPDTVSTIYQSTRRCLGEDVRYRGTYAQIQWFAADAIEHSGCYGTCAGLWKAPATIYVHHPHLGNLGHLRHELTHLLTQDGAHDTAAYKRCWRG